MSKKQSSAGGKAAKLAAVAINIARGAATGGPYGAAIGAVQSFLPQLIKIAVVIIVLLLLIPFLILSAIPNIIFGFNSSDAPNIIEFTQQAQNIDAAYREVQNFNQETIDRIIAQIEAEHTSENGVPAFDNVEVNENIDNTNMYWFIAITSVAHQQDLFTMDENSIRNATVNRIVYTSSISDRSEGEGEYAAIMRTLTIDIEDLNPQELMDQLGFSDEERNWARVLYSTLAEEQYVGYRDRDGEGFYNVNFGNRTFTDTDIEVVYFNQTDSRWGNVPFGRSGTIGTSGCGPAALAMVVATMTNHNVTPREVAAWAVANGFRAEGMGSYHSLMPAGGRHYGLNVEGIGRDSHRLVEALENGNLVIAIMSRGHFTSSGHFIVLRGITAEGRILVADSASYARSNQTWNLHLIMNELNRNAGSGGPLWVFSN